MSWLNGPMVAYDCESTGVDVETDRIVTATVVELHPREGGGRIEPVVRTTVIDPGVPVPDAAAEVHGWTTERVQAEGKPPVGELDWIAADLATSLAGGIPVVIANAPYDLSILDRELRRHSLPTLDERLDGRPIAPVIDPMCIDKAVDQYRPGGRKLTDLCATYGVKLGGAHDATEDALGAARVAFRIGQRAKQALADPAGVRRLYADRRYPDRLVQAWQALGRMSLAELHQAQGRWYAEQSESFAAYLRREAHEIDVKTQRHGVDADARAQGAQEAEELRRRADEITGDWPARPWTGGR